MIVLLLAWLWQEVARWGAIREASSIAAAQKVGSIVRNRLSKALGEALVIFATLVGWVVLDTVAIRYAQGTVAKASVALLVALGPLLPVLRWIGMNAMRQISTGGKKGFSLVYLANALGIPLALFVLFVLDVLAHRIFVRYPAEGIWVVLLIGLFSLVLGRAFDFLNLSSLRATYASRLTRTFLGHQMKTAFMGRPQTKVAMYRKRIPRMTCLTTSIIRKSREARFISSTFASTRLSISPPSARYANAKAFRCV